MSSTLAPLAIQSNSFSFRETLSDGSTRTRYLGDLGVLVQDSPIPGAGALDKSAVLAASSNLLVEGGQMLTRSFAFRVIVPTRDFREAGTIRARMIKWLYVRGEGRLWFDVWEPDTFFRAALSDVSDVQFTGTGFAMTLTFLITPFRFSFEEYVITQSLTTDPQTVVFDGTTPINGMQIAHPTWVFQNNTGAPITDPITIFNTTTNESLTWEGAWPDTEFLRIDATGRKVIELAATEAALGDPGTSIMSGITPGSPFPTLQGEEINSVTFTGLQDTGLTLRYHAEF